MDRICWVCGGRIDEGIAEKLGTPVAKLGLSKRAINSLTRGNIKYIEQLVKLEIDDLSRLWNMGKVTISEVINKVKEFGLDCWQ